MSKLKKYDEHHIRYVTASKGAVTGSHTAYQLRSCGEVGDFSFNSYGYRTVVLDAKSEAGEEVFVVVDVDNCSEFPSEVDPEFSDKVAKAAPRRKPQLAYERVASDELVDFYRVRSIVRLEDKDDTPVFAFVD